MESPSAGCRRRRHGRRARPSRRRPLLCAALVCVTVVGGTAAGTAYVRARGSAGPGAVGSASPSASASASASGRASVETVTDQAADRTALLAGAMKSVAPEDGATVSVAVLDLGSGQSAVYGDGTFD